MSSFIRDIHYLLSLKGVLDSSLFKNGTNDENVQKNCIAVLLWYPLLQTNNHIHLFCNISN